jgi:hypothetical protein
MEGSSPVFGSGVGEEEEEEYAAAVQGRSSSGGFTHEGSVSQLLSQVQQQSPERDKTLEEEEEEEQEEQEEGNLYQEAAKTDDSSLGGDGGGAEAHEGFTFDTNLASMHTYLGGFYYFLAPLYMLHYFSATLKAVTCILSLMLHPTIHLYQISVDHLREDICNQV